MGAGLLLARLQPRTICFEAPAYFGICFSLESCTIVLRKARNAQEGERRISGGRVPSIFRLILISSVQQPYLRSTGKTNIECCSGHAPNSSCCESRDAGLRIYDPLVKTVQAGTRR